MTEPERIEVTRRIAATRQKLFRLITDPREQIRIDGSGMLVSTPHASPVTAVGDVFEMEMDREPLGDVPLGRYRVVNTVTKFVKDGRLEWNVAWPGSPPFGHVYGYLLESATEYETDVSSYCDWSSLTESWRGHLEFPVVPAAMLEQSLERLSRLVGDPPPDETDE